MNILWVTPKLTFPTEDGARVATDAIGSQLSSLCDRVDIFYFREEMDVKSDLYQKRWGAKQTFCAPRKYFKNLMAKARFWLGRFVLHPLTPVSTAVFDTLGSRIEFHKLLENNSYDLIVFDVLHPWAMARNVLKDNHPKLIYRAHNVESEIWASAARKAKWPLSLFLWWQAKVMGDLEVDLLKRADQVWAISAEDMEIFSKETSRVKLVPVGMKFRAPKIFKGPNIKLFFLGRMDWGPNKDGLKWFLDEVWPEVITKREDIELYIAGSGDSSWLESYKELSQTHFLGRVESVEDTYALMDLSITPIFYGSGTRIKVIESVANGVPLISSKMGVQGSGLQEGDFLHVETAHEWAQALINLKGEELNLLAHHSSNRLRPLLDGASVAARALKEDLDKF